jgi:uncharacterized protein (TIGR02996 family)
MVSDANFLDRLLADPTDDATRLVYADWLEEQGDDESNAKAQFLRLTAELGGPDARKRKKSRRHRLQQLAANLDTDWLGIVSRLDIEMCYAKQMEVVTGQWRFLRASPPLEFLCDRKWEELQSAPDRDVRFCEQCQHNVFYCDTIIAAREHAHEGHCVAVDLGVIRRKDDLFPRMRLMGRIPPAAFHRTKELMKPDAVSAERMRRKQRAQNAAATEKVE